MTTIQSALNKLQAFQECKGFQLGGKGPELKNLAAEIKYLWPTLNEEDKALFTAAVARGCFAIEKKYIWPLFCEAVGVAAPVLAPVPAPIVTAPAAAPAPQTNKVAAEILEHCQSTRTVLGLLNKTLEAMLLTLERQADSITVLTQQVEALKKPAPRRVAKLAAV